MQCHTRQAESAPTIIEPEISSVKHAMVYQIRLRAIENPQVCTDVVCKQACFVMQATDVKLSDYEYSETKRKERKPSCCFKGRCVSALLHFWEARDVLRQKIEVLL